MAPMNWLMLFIFFIIILMFIMTLIYFYFLKYTKFNLIKNQNLKNYNKFI
uniref:ATP synthase F0 subunit 8 n=1 Tax=Melaphis rhois TaxID=13142 RepID=A0A343KAQ3_9HEMI|nr:ATP synthase F0 subunit 8 [Melaphis rhois]ATE90576.1 ATP synthase F0 subunit 8 [Melaphis rhois]